MSTTSYDSVWSLGSTRIVVPVGVTAGVFIQPFQGQVNCMLKLTAGGSCEILPPGQTLLGGTNDFLQIAQSGSTLQALSGNGYAMGQNEQILINGPAAFYLSSLGVTSIVNALFGKGQGY